MKEVNSSSLRKGAVAVAGGKGENQAQRCEGDKGHLFVELRGKERILFFHKHLLRTCNELPGTVLSVTNKTDKMLVHLEFTF